MERFVEFLDHWQSLAGAVIGVLASLGIVFLVAYVNHRRDDVSAALVVSGCLTSLRVAAATIREVATKKGVTESDLPMFVAERLTFYMPALSPLFDASAARMMPVHVALAAHLELVRVGYHGLQEHVRKVSRDFEHFQVNGKHLRDAADTLVDARTASNYLFTAAQHAKCAEHLLTLLMLSKWRMWHRARYRFRPSSPELECMGMFRAEVRSPPDR